MMSGVIEYLDLRNSIDAACPMNLFGQPKILIGTDISFI
jgi:hypothetical protein